MLTTIEAETKVLLASLALTLNVIESGKCTEYVCEVMVIASLAIWERACACRRGTRGAKNRVSKQDIMSNRRMKRRKDIDRLLSIYRHVGRFCNGDSKYKAAIILYLIQTILYTCDAPKGRFC